MSIQKYSDERTSRSITLGYYFSIVYATLSIICLILMPLGWLFAFMSIYFLVLTIAFIIICEIEKNRLEIRREADLLFYKINQLEISINRRK